MTDEFVTIYFRVNQSDRTAAVDGFKDLRYGDSVKAVVTGLPGVVPASLELWLFEKAASPDTYLSVTGFAAVPGRADEAYATVAVENAGLVAALAVKAPGTPVTARLYITDGTVTVVDQDVDIYPSPAFDGTPAAAGDPLIRASDLAAVRDTIASMPTLTAAQREARLGALIDLFATLAG